MAWYNILKHYGIVLKDFFWRMDSAKNESSSVQEYLRRNTDKAMILVNSGKLPYFKNLLGKPDLCIKAIYNYVWKAWKWESDWDNYKKVEMWEDLDVVMANYEHDLKFGNVPGIDCESMATLIYCLARLHRINPLQLYLVVGRVKEGGHCWLQYISDDGNNYAVDAAYSPKLSRFKLMDDPIYLSVSYKTTYI